MIRPYNVPGWVYFILGTGLAASLFFSIYSFLMIMSLPEFKGLGIIESGDVSLSYYSSTMMSGCSNKSVGVMSRTFTGTTIIAYGCPTTRNFCSEYVCTGERICEEVLSPGSGCSEDKDCTGEAERCDTASCTCVPDGTRCTMDSQCLDLNATSVCVESFCDVSEGQCKTRYINETMDSCDNDNNCGDDLICRGCMCISMPEMNVTSCTMDSECIDYTETSDCIEAFCNMTTLSCATRFQDMSFDCDGSCPQGQTCNDCVCTNITFECATASECLNTTSTSECVEVECVMGQCQTQFIGNATCDGSCPAGQICQDCVCSNITTENTFPDNTFRIFDEFNNDSQFAFNASEISPSTTRTLTVQDQDGTIALLSDTWTLAYSGNMDFRTGINTGVFFNNIIPFSLYRSGRLRFFTMGNTGSGTVSLGTGGCRDSTSIAPEDAGRGSTIIRCSFRNGPLIYSTMLMNGNFVDISEGVSADTSPGNIFCFGGQIIYEIL